MDPQHAKAQAAKHRDLVAQLDSSNLAGLLGAVLGEYSRRFGKQQTVTILQRISQQIELLNDSQLLKPQ